MTGTGGLDGLGGIPQLALDDDGLDVLELLLTGALPAPPPLVGAPDAGEVVLTDGENSPLARRTSTPGAGASVIPLRPLPTGSGPQWDSTLRRSAADVCQQLRSVAGDGPVLAIIVDEVPSIADGEAAKRAIERAGSSAVLWVVPTARDPGNSEVGWAGLTRAARAAAGSLADDTPGVLIVPVVVPWPDDAGRGRRARSARTTQARGGVRWDAAGLNLDDVLAAYGATETRRLADLRSPAERERIAALAGLFEREVRAIYPPASADEILRVRQQARSGGAVVFFTGLSGSGKSTIARALADDLADGGRRVTLLDGDQVRRHLSSELGFDDRSREINIDRTAYVASLIAAHGGIAIVALIAPFEASRRAARALVEPHGTFLLVYVNTPLEVCEGRDRKGMYARARAGELADFTGVSSPFEPPGDPDVVIDTSRVDVGQAVRLVREALERRLDDLRLAESAT